MNLDSELGQLERLRRKRIQAGANHCQAVKRNLYSPLDCDSRREDYWINCYNKINVKFLQLAAQIRQHKGE